MTSGGQRGGMVAVVIRGASGIGEATCRVFGHEGMRVVVCDLVAIAAQETPNVILSGSQCLGVADELSVHGGWTADWGVVGLGSPIVFET
jgi:NAD(P)-dependent dehydrogenase (short-subunit alcohol dehydrogenase family)